MTKEETNHPETVTSEEALRSPGAPATGEGPEAGEDEVPQPAEEKDERSVDEFGDEDSPQESPTGEGSEAGGPERPASELESALAELQKLRDQHLRLAADFENYRKRASNETSGVWVRARADLVQSLVEGLDDLQRVSQFTSEDTTVEALIEGVDLVERNLLKALTEAGLEVLNPEGERFDPNTMEAMMRVPTEDDSQDETVHQVFLKGYMFKDQLVRPARVSVYKDED